MVIIEYDDSYYEYDDYTWIFQICKFSAFL